MSERNENKAQQSKERKKKRKKKKLRIAILLIVGKANLVRQPVLTVHGAGCTQKK